MVKYASTHLHVVHNNVYCKDPTLTLALATAFIKIILKV